MSFEKSHNIPTFDLSHVEFLSCKKIRSKGEITFTSSLLPLFYPSHFLFTIIFTLSCNDSVCFFLNKLLFLLKLLN